MKSRFWKPGLTVLLACSILSNIPCRGSEPNRSSNEHWAFKPVTRPPLPGIKNTSWPRNELDQFILAALEKNGLQPSPEADKLALIRRLHFVLIGLPPTPEQVNAFINSTDPNAYEKLVDSLLASPHYGERWARHWLDIIAFGETHGFEVNTPRENAWPYRDYVIRALQQDKPYPEFIKDQLAGDLTGEDTATGFLVATAALLPGQIGRDLESILLARQDELNNIVHGTASAFLGLTVSCARCHDHKFDPVPQKDYYSIQAVFSGVRFGEREIRPTNYEQRLAEAAKLRPELEAIQADLSRFELRANPNIKIKSTSPKLNEESFPETTAKFVRLVIEDCNLHPALGLIEPCIDEFEIFSNSAPSNNLALASLGTKVTASGSNTSDLHRLEHINDGKYGNSKSWMSNEKGRGWVLFELPSPSVIKRIVWSRDRLGEYKDRLPTAYRIELGTSLDSLHAVAGSPPLRSPVNARKNIERFDPVTARRVRFTILECNNLEPCLDELEIFTAGTNPRNVALASAGATAKASSTILNSSNHRLEHLNDGQYGNSRSWLCREGKGWVEIEFPQSFEIDTIHWGRDRLGQYSDRLPINYTIESAEDSGTWRLIASSVDRRKFLPGKPSAPAVYATDHLSPADREQFNQLHARAAKLETHIAELEKKRMVYAGNFNSPEAVHRLHRGDPMQKREPVSPSALSQIGPKLELPSDLPEQARRVALAEWIGNTNNPLTARVMMNRLWQHHFGEGLVNTPSDFGVNGARPLNPELLDWLASEFMAQGWSLKKMHRLICVSSAYRQSSQPSPKGLAIDASSRLLWRYPPRRLDAEVIRDSMLSVCGTLDLRMGGPGYSVFAPNDNYVRVYDPKKDYGPSEWRRMIYQTKVRMAQDSTFGAFDCPDAGQTQPKRPRSTTPLQALNLFNSEFVNQQASYFAQRLQKESGPKPAHQVRQAYMLAFGRAPDLEEGRLCEDLVSNHGLEAFCRVILNANEFVFVN